MFLFLSPPGLARTWHFLTPRRVCYGVRRFSTAGEVLLRNVRNPPFCVRDDAALFRVHASDSLLPSSALEPSARAVEGKLKAEPGIGRKVPARFFSSSESQSRLRGRRNVLSQAKRAANFYSSALEFYV